MRFTLRGKALSLASFPVWYRFRYCLDELKARRNKKISLNYKSATPSIRK
jgi:hypothetical protein